MKNLNTYKTISVVAMNNVSIAMTVKEDGSYQHMKKVGTNNTVAQLKVLKSLLTNIEENNDNTKQARMIILGSKSAIKGFATGSYVEYIRTGANASGKQFTEEEFTLVKEVAQLYATRCLNVRITTDEFISKNDKTTKALISNSWEQIKAMIKLMNGAAPAQQQPAKTSVQSTIDKLNAQLDKAIEECDLDKMERLTAMIAKLSGNTTPVVEDTKEDVVEQAEEERNADEELAQSLGLTVDAMNME